jgi:hypothetical protein
MMRKYPIGLQDFKGIREGNYLYVDKTRYLFDLLEQGKYYFLSRPRRFGKSLTVSTLKYLFSGEQTLFEGLWIADHYDFTQRFPVIHLEFNNLDHREVGLHQALTYRMNELGREHGVSLDAPSPGLMLDQLVRALSAKNKVVILIDEYDKPVLDYLDEPEKARQVRDELKGLYSPLKSLDAHLRFVLLTGVSKFSRMSIFSELNNLEDLTLNRNFAGLTGYTEQELEHYFIEDALVLSQEMQVGLEAFWANMREWYNGYTWDGKTRMYNPFSVLSLFKQGSFQNFWFATGTPTFLVKLLQKDLSYDFAGYPTDLLTLDSGFELGMIDPVALLFQAGYLTITEKNGTDVVMDFPNREVKDSLFRYLLTGFAHQPLNRAPALLHTFVQAFARHKLADFIEGLDSLFASIPADIFIARREAYYHSLTHLALTLLGTKLRSEVHSRRGRLDAQIETEQHVYLLEFKVDQSAEAALAQIRERGYAEAYRTSGKAVWLLGINFSSEKRGVENWLLEEENQQ